MLTALLALQHSDSAFPSGAFAFSNGIEGFFALPGDTDAGSVRHYVASILRHRWIGTDRVALVHAFRGAADLERLAAVDRAVEAASLAEPLRTGSRRAGRALLTTHVRLATPGARTLHGALADGALLGHLATLQGSLWHALRLPEDQIGMIAGYQAVAGLVSAAVRLGGIGALDAQAIIRDTLPLLAELLREPVPHSDEIALASFAPLNDIVALRGTGGATRLFSN